MGGARNTARRHTDSPVPRTGNGQRVRECERPVTCRRRCSHLEVLFERRDRRDARARRADAATVRQLRRRDLAPPLEERVLLCAMQFRRVHAVVPPRAARDAQRARGAAGGGVALPRGGARARLGGSGRIAVAHEGHVGALGDEARVREHRLRHEVLQRRHLRHGLQRVARRREVGDVEARAARGSKGGGECRTRWRRFSGAEADIVFRGSVPLG